MRYLLVVALLAALTGCGGGGDTAAVQAGDTLRQIQAGERFVTTVTFADDGYSFQRVDEYSVDVPGYLRSSVDDTTWGIVSYTAEPGYVVVYSTSTPAGQVPDRVKFRYPERLVAGATVEVLAFGQQQQVTLSGPVTVSTPAGRFRCYTYSYDRYGYTVQHWLCPSLGVVVKAQEYAPDGYTATLSTYSLAP